MRHACCLYVCYKIIFVLFVSYYDRLYYWCCAYLLVILFLSGICRFDENSQLIVSVFDWDYGKSDDFIGAAQMELKPLFDYKERDQWYGLTKLKKTKEKVRQLLRC